MYPKNQNDDWYEEVCNGQMGNADEQGEESINDEQGENNINEDEFPLYPGALLRYK